ncbi:MAG: 2Fe-2S iron-sulfur cluster binding domain-containing protein, partial [Deltaproteobacteria bacterium]|nr:2Fe-2S iron-sulfur cluster binding domain-containing protein [Deltaproteobacteria bacterium]
MKKEISFTLNGKRVGAEVDVSSTLLDVLREQFELTGTKEGCGVGECGACTVLVNGLSINSCLMPILEVESA